MVFEFKFPDVGEGIAEGKLVSWKVKIGEKIVEHETICEVETDKAVVEIPAPISGVVTELLANEGDMLDVGDVFMKIDENGDDSKNNIQNSNQIEISNTEEIDVSETKKSYEEDDLISGKNNEIGPTDNNENESNKNIEIKPIDNSQILAMPKIRAIAKERGIDLSTVKGSGKFGEIVESDLNNGSQINNNNMINEQNISKNTSSNEIGVEISDDQNNSSNSNNKEIKIEKQIPPHILEDVEEIDVSEIIASKPINKNVVASLSTKQLARNLGVDINEIKGSGEGGKVLDIDVRNAFNNKSNNNSEITSDKDVSESTIASNDKEISNSKVNEIPNQKENLVDDLNQIKEEIKENSQSENNNTNNDINNQSNENSSSNLPVQSSKSEEVTIESTGSIELSGIRGTISSRMVESLAKTAQVTISDEAVISDLVEFRNLEKAKLEDKGIKLTYLPFFMKAIVFACREYPVFNAIFDEKNKKLDMKAEFNIGVATDTNRGLLVPNVNNCEKKSVIAISKEIMDNTIAARDGKLSPKKMQNGTISITSIGSLGGQFFTPILNYPQVAILGIGKIVKKPIVKNDKIVIGDVVTISLTFDHRFIDGADGARFLKRYIELIEDVEELLLE